MIDIDCDVSMIWPIKGVYPMRSTDRPDGSSKACDEAHLHARIRSQGHIRQVGVHRRIEGNRGHIHRGISSHPINLTMSQ